MIHENLKKRHRERNVRQYSPQVRVFSLQSFYFRLAFSNSLSSFTNFSMPIRAAVSPGFHPALHILFLSPDNAQLNSFCSGIFCCALGNPLFF